MKTLLKSALVVILTITFTELHSQVRTGYVFGLNLSTIALKNNEVSYDGTTPVGFHFGGFCELPLNDNFAFRPTLLFSAKGTDYKIDTLEYSLSPIYIEVPVNMMCSFGSDVVRVSLFAGPYFAVGIGGYKIIPGGELKDISYGSDVSSDLRPFDVGFNLGAGVSIRGFLISVQYGLGLENIAPDAKFYTEMNNKVIGISISAGTPGLKTSFGR
jgi:hypothetical protein